MTRKALITAVALLLAVIVNAQYKAGYSDLGDSACSDDFFRYDGRPQGWFGRGEAHR